jgi:hypothetical protein
LVAVRASLWSEQGVNHSAWRQATDLVKSHEVSGVAFKANALGIYPNVLSTVFNTGVQSNGQWQTFNLNE